MGELKPCGTPAAWRRHKRHGEEPCAACRKAHNDAVATYKNREWRPRELRGCGTEAAYQRAVRRRKQLREAGDLAGAQAAAPCFRCRVAHSHYVAKYVKASRARKRAA